MAEQKLSMQSEVLKLAELVSTLTQQVSEMKAQKVRNSGKVLIEVTGTDNPKVIKFVKSIYERVYRGKDATMKNKAYDKIKEIEVGIMHKTPTGLLRYPIRKILADGTMKSMALRDFKRETV